MTLINAAVLSRTQYDELTSPFKVSKIAVKSAENYWEGLKAL